MKGKLLFIYNSIANNLHIQEGLASRIKPTDFPTGFFRWNYKPYKQFQEQKTWAQLLRL